MQTGVHTSFPSIDEIRAAMPDGRSEYRESKRTIDPDFTDQAHSALPWVIIRLSQAHEAGTMRPPLTTEIGRLVTRMRGHIRYNPEIGHVQVTSNFSERSALEMLGVVVEHGYMNGARE